MNETNDRITPVEDEDFNVRQLAYWERVLRESAAAGCAASTLALCRENVAYYRWRLPVGAEVVAT